MARVIDLNCDMGEGHGTDDAGIERALLDVVSSANIACGFHAGDAETMATTVRLAESCGVGVGAHPGFADRHGFGRRPMEMTGPHLRHDVMAQIRALTVCTSRCRLQHVKPHGALYNMAVSRADYADAITEAIQAVDPGMILVALAGSPWLVRASRAGVCVAAEAYADRAIRSDGTLVPRSESGAVITDAAAVAARVVQLAVDGTVQAITGECVPVQAQTVCLHGDTPGAVQLALRIRVALEAAGVMVRPLAEILRRDAV